jgi:deoxyribonuclease V
VTEEGTKVERVYTSFFAKTTRKSRRPALPHRVSVAPEEAREVQERLAGLVETEDRLGPVRLVAGADARFEPGVAWAAVAVLSLPELERRDQAAARWPDPAPYVPGLFSLREAPAVLAALADLRIRPDVLLCDGHGLAHPRRFGLACHVGVLADLPTVGVAKTRLVGHHGDVPGARGAWAPLVHEGEVVGAALRTRPGVKPVYVSTGHRVSLPTAIELVLRCSPRYRVPEPIRRAHELAAVAGADGTKCFRGRGAVR